MGIGKDKILDYDLFLYNMDRPALVGLDSAMLSSPRLDNLTSVGAILEALEQCGEVPDNTIDVMVVFDNEEVGSLSKQGADSELLPMVLDKIGQAAAGKAFALRDVVGQSFLLSVEIGRAHV